MRAFDSKQVKALDKTQNPLRQRSGEGFSTLSMSIAVPKTKEWEEIIKGLRHNAAEVKASLGHVFRSALLEYYDRHAEGNPIAQLECYMGLQPFSKAAQEKGFGKEEKLEQLPPKTLKFTCQRCDGKGCDKCGNLGFYYGVHQ